MARLIAMSSSRMRTASASSSAAISRGGRAATAAMSRRIRASAQKRLTAVGREPASSRSPLTSSR